MVFVCAVIGIVIGIVTCICCKKKGYCVKKRYDLLSFFKIMSYKVTKKLNK